MTRGFPVLLVLVLLTGFAALDRETDGFRIVTSAGARQLAVERAPQPLPDAKLIDQDGTPFTLAGYRGKPLLVDFIYTRCPTICGVLGDDFARLTALLDSARRRQPIDLLSISFDPSDDRMALRFYAERFGAKAPRWRIAVAATARARTALLQSFGVVVIPDGIGGFIHDDSIYVVDGGGRLARILDSDAPAQRVTAALKVTAP